MTVSNAVLDSLYADMESNIISGSAVSYPRVSFQAADDTVLHEIDLSATDPLGAPTDGVGSYNPPQGEASWVGYSITIGAGISGTPAKAIIYNRDNEAVQEDTVSTVAAGTGNWQFSTTTWVPGLELTFNAAPNYTVRNPV